PYFPNQQPAECGHYYPDVLTLRDERKPDGTFVRILDCTYCGQYELLLDARHLSRELARKLKRTGREIAIQETEIANVRKKRFEEMLSGDKKITGLTLHSIIETAIQQGAETIELEYVTEGMEVTYMSGSYGVGEVIDNRKSIKTIIDELVTQAKLEQKTRGTFKWIYDEREYEVRAEQYESFGESAFRLILKKSKQSA
ncbi:MAG TPA: hypothetical protein VI338_03935, partial [Nitrososphaera sp.]|nr:hypothetical protein [Nitrososphaera sp.]